jgi:hypothetical protein
MTKRVTTYQAPNGETIDLTRPEIRHFERIGEWRVIRSDRNSAPYRMAYTR